MQQTSSWLDPPVMAEAYTLRGITIPDANRVSPNMERILGGGSYEQAEADLLSALLQDGDRVLELGAGCGYLSTLAAQRLGSDSVVAVEPDPELVEMCRATFEANGVDPLLLHRAVYAEEGTVFLLRTLDFWSNKLVQTPNQYCVQVPALTLGQLVDAHHPTVIVCDIEGAEKHCCGTQLPDTVRAVIIETHSPMLHVMVRDWMKAEGFAVSSSRQRTSAYVRTELLTPGAG